MFSILEFENKVDVTYFDPFSENDPDLTELGEACVSLRWSQTADDSFD